MENIKLIEKLKNKSHISYEEAKDLLERLDWNLLDAMLYLEEKGKIKKPSVSIFYTNENKASYKYIEVINKKEKNNYNNYKKESTFQGLFELLCKVIDTCNNIFLEIRKENRIFLKIPITVVILLLIFTFWIVIPLAIIGLFCDIELSLSSSKVEVNKANNIFKEMSRNAKSLKEQLKKGFKNG